MRTSKARPPIPIGPPVRILRRCGKIGKRPNSTIAGVSDIESIGAHIDGCRIL